MSGQEKSQLENSDTSGKLAVVLMLRILDLVMESGANQREAASALRAAEAMLPEVELKGAPTVVIET
jgi:hypothetical protein